MDAGVRAPAPDIRILSLALAAGILAAHACARLPPLCWLLLLALPAVLPWRGRALWSVATLGVLLTVLQAQHRLADRWPAARHGEEIETRGYVVSLPERSAGRAADEGATLRFEFAPEGKDLPQKIRVSWYRSEAVLRGGECWTLRLRLRTPHGSLDPGAFDYEGWLYRRGVGASATVRTGERCEDARAYPVLRARQALIDRLDTWLGAHPGKAMVAALTVGEESGFSDADWTVFRETGTSHLVAISGFNVAILAGLAFLLVRWTWPASRGLAQRLPAQKAAMIAAALAGLVYSLLAGWESPAQRSALMLLLVLIAALPDRRAEASRVLALALGLMLAFDPSVILSPGLWLSFGAVAAIFYSSSGRLRAPSAWRTAISMQLMLSVMLAPLTLYFFLGVAWLGPLVNLVAVPAMALMTPLVLAAVALAWLIPAWGLPALMHVADALQGMQSALAWLAQAPQAWTPASPPLAALALALFGAVLMFAPRGWPARGLALLCFVPLWMPPQTAARAPFEMTALDVGQGLSVVVRTAQHTLLFDAGPAFEDGFDAGESVVAPFVLGLGQRGIDRLLLSHGDSDHAGGVPAVRRLVRVGDELGTPGHEACREGQAWDWDGVHFELLNPDETERSDNNRSCVLRVSAPARDTVPCDSKWVRERADRARPAPTLAALAAPCPRPGLSALLTGDIEREAEEHLLTAHAEQLKADVLIAPHHGSKTSSTEAFVRAVAPKVVVFGAAWRSHYGHPRPEVVARYLEVGSEPLTTGVEGAVRVWRDSEGKIRTESWRREAAHFWNAAPEP